MSAGSVLIVVPARGGSQRLPGKNLMSLAGRSLLAWTAEYLREEGLLDQAILTTDSTAIAEAGVALGLAVPFMRPGELATAGATTFAVVLHALEWRKEQYGTLPDFTVVLQVTSPFRSRGALRAALEQLAGDPSINSVIAMQRLRLPGSYTFFGPRVASRATEKADAVYQPAGSLYATRTQALIGQGTLYAEPIAVAEVTPAEAMDIDDETDFRLAGALLAAGLIASPEHSFRNAPG